MAGAEGKNDEMRTGRAGLDLGASSHCQGITFSLRTVGPCLKIAECAMWRTHCRGPTAEAGTPVRGH